MRSEPSSTPEGGASARQVVGLVVVCIGASIMPLDTAVNISFPHIAADLGVRLTDIQWVVICYVTTYASLMLVCGKLGDLFGYRRVFMIGLAMATAALALCALAPTFGWLLFFRFLQGLATALVVSCAPALATLMFPESSRARVLGFYTMTYGMGNMLGPWVGGMMIEVFGWEGVFGFRAPLAGLAFLAALAIVEPAREKAAGERLDVVGAVVAILAMATLLATVSLLQAAGGTRWWAVALGLLAAAVVWFFWRHEDRHPSPLIRPQAFRDMPFSVINGANVVVNFVAFAVLLLVPFYLVRATELSAGWAGAVMAAGTFGWVVASPLGGRLIGRVNPRRMAALGLALVGCGLLGTARWSAESFLPLMVATLFVQGVGMGLFQVAYMSVVTGTLARRDRGVAGSLTMLTRTIGVVIGVQMLTLIHDGAEGVALAAGADALDAFMVGFRWTFQVAGGGMLAFLALTALSPRNWWTREADR